MIKGFYAAVSGMVANFARAQTISNNLSNLGTIGYKEDVNSFREFRTILLNRLGQNGEAPLGSIGTGSEISRAVLKMDQGSFRETDNPLDIAVEGPGFFAVQTPAGTSYTRAGNLYRDQAGNLVTGDGSSVLGQNGPIVLPAGDAQFAIDGTVLVGGQAVDKLQIAEFANPDHLKKQGSNRYQATDAPLAANNTQILGGYVEE